MACPRPPSPFRRFNSSPEVIRLIDQITAGGGAVHLGPRTVPTGERIVIGADPQGAAFSLVSPA